MSQWKWHVAVIILRLLVNPAPTWKQSKIAFVKLFILYMYLDVPVVSFETMRTRRIQSQQTQLSVGMLLKIVAVATTTVIGMITSRANYGTVATEAFLLVGKRSAWQPQPHQPQWTMLSPTPSFVRNPSFLSLSTSTTPITSIATNSVMVNIDDDMKQQKVNGNNVNDLFYGCTTQKYDNYDVVTVDLDDDRDYPIYIGTDFTNEQGTTNIFILHILVYCNIFMSCSNARVKSHVLNNLVPFPCYMHI